MTLEQRLMEIYAHLQTAVVQSLPSDDQIIMGHVRDALALVGEALRELRNEPVAALVETLTDEAA